MNTNQQSKDRQITLTAGQEISVDVSGRFFFIESSDGAFAISFNDGPYMAARAGFEVNQFEFQKIKFKSLVTTGGATITIRYYAGTAYVTNRNPSVFTRPAPSYVVGYTGSLAAAASFTIPNTNLRTGQPAADKQLRLQIMTASGTGTLQVKVDSVIVGVCVTNGAMYPLETSAEVVVTANGDTHTYYVAAFYSLPG